MKETIIRCDVCSMQLFYENSVGGKDSFRSISTGSFQQDDKVANMAGRHFCGLECFTERAKEVESVIPLEEDRLKSLAEKLEYKLVKIKTKVVEVTEPPKTETTLT